MKRIFLTGCMIALTSSGALAGPSQPAQISEPVSAPPQSKIFNAESFMLKNGMQVVVIPNHRAPVVTHMVWYKVGAADEPQGDGISGVAHFLEHLMFKGSRALQPGELSKIVRSLGGEDNAFTSWDFTSYYQSIAREYLPTVMAFEADRMVNMAPPQNQIDSELQVVIEERRQRTDNDPRALFSEQLRATLFNASPYGIPVLGWREEMPRMKWQHMYDYYKTWYAPNNAILVVSGDITAEQLRPLAEKYYGVLKARDVPAHIRADIPDFPAQQRMTLRHADVQQPVFIRAWRAPSFIQDKRTSHALEVLEDVLSGGPSTRLYQSLVVKEKLSTSIELSYDGDNRGSGSLWLYAVPAPGVALEKLESAIEAELSSLIGNGLSTDEIERAKLRMMNNAIYARDSVSSPAMIVGQALASGMTLDDVEYWPRSIAAVKQADVQSALTTYLNPDTPRHLPVTGYLLPVQEGRP